MGLFGVLLAASGIVALIHPEATFAGFADILGFVFLRSGFSGRSRRLPSGSSTTCGGWG